MTYDLQTTVATIATEHPLATRVFARHGIDFCCGGGRPLAAACAAQGLDAGAVLAEIEDEIAAAPGPEESWAVAPIEDLIQHILTTYHEPLKQELPRIEEMARKVHRVHGDKDPERLSRILSTFCALQQDLVLHLAKEEQILFPMILAGDGAMAGGPISVMEHDHDAAGSMLRTLRELTDDYVPPEMACNTWRALWAALADLERALHEHIHLENNVLHPRALAG